MRAVLQLVIILLLAGLVMVGAYLIGFGVNYWLVRTQTTEVNVPSNFGLFWEAWNIIKGEFYGTIPERQTLTHGAIRGMLGALNDPHSVFVPPESAKDEQATLQGKTGDVGLHLDSRNHIIVVIAPAPNSPAEKAGIRGGDILLKIDDKDITPEMTAQDVATKLRGPVGSQVSITFRHVGEPKSETVSLTREQYSLPTVQSKLVPDTKFGYVKITMETSETAKEFAQALDALKAQQIAGLILDLRNNPGGLFPDPVLDIAGQFLKNGEIVVYEKYRDGTEKSYNAGGRRGATDIPLVVLVNNGTASGAEILAGALKDYKRAVLIGEPTYGKGSVQSVRQLSDGSAVHITIATWFTPKRNEIQGTGLQPDIAVPLTEFNIKQNIDTQLERAIEYLKKGA